MELLKTEYSENKGIGKLDKTLINCRESNYYKLIEFLYVSQNEQALVLNSLYNHKINVVLKFNIIQAIQKEYNISLNLFELPNFIRYFCIIECNDSIKNIINHKQTISNYKICQFGNNPIGILVMKYYDLGCIDNYKWNYDNIDILKNIIIQVIFAIIYAYQTIGFIHGDLHCGNILLKQKKICFLNYRNISLKIITLQGVIMDFEKSKINQNNIIDLFRNIDKFITSIDNVCNKNGYFLDIDKKKIISLKSSLEINNIYNEVESIINNMYIYN
jgi:hypothetical protein